MEKETKERMACSDRAAPISLRAVPRASLKGASRSHHHEGGRRAGYAEVKHGGT